MLCSEKEEKTEGGMVEVSERKEKEEFESVMHVGSMTKSISKNLNLPSCIGLKRFVIDCKKKTSKK